MTDRAEQNLVAPRHRSDGGRPLFSRQVQHLSRQDLYQIAQLHFGRLCGGQDLLHQVRIDGYSDAELCEVWQGVLERPVGKVEERGRM